MAMVNYKPGYFKPFFGGTINMDLFKQFLGGYVANYNSGFFKQFLRNPWPTKNLDFLTISGGPMTNFEPGFFFAIFGGSMVNYKRGFFFTIFGGSMATYKCTFFKQIFENPCPNIKWIFYRKFLRMHVQL